MTSIREQHGEALRAARKAANYSQATLSRLSMVDQGSISLIERGKACATDETRMRIAAALGMRVEEIWSYPDTSAAVAS